jgi:RimJ/RimL family protein N-acetyltransferase
MTIVETSRLILREMDAALDAAFIFELLNSPKFIQYIGDRGVRSIDEALEFIDTRYRRSYADHGYGLYTVCLRDTGEQIGICGFVKRDYLDEPDLGFAFLPQHESKGYGTESAAASITYGREQLGFDRVMAITSLDNDTSVRLLKKVGFRFEKEILSGTETLKLFVSDPDQ